MKAENRGTLLLLLSLLCTMLLALHGCGKKVWPEPLTEEDSFSWHNATAQLASGCLEIHAVMTGNVMNLDTVTVEYEPLDGETGCLSCPFQPRARQELSLASPQLKRRGSVLEMAVCGLDPAVNYRWRLVGANVHPLIDDAVSPVGAAFRADSSAEQ